MQTRGEGNKTATMEARGWISSNTVIGVLCRRFLNELISYLTVKCHTHKIN